MNTSPSEITIASFLAALNANDLDALDKVFSPDIVMEYPHS